MKIKILFLVSLITISCKNETKTETPSNTQKDILETALKPKVNAEINIEEADTLALSKKHKINQIQCDLDGDGKDELVEIIRSTKNNKSGLKITFGNNKRTDYFGFGNNVLNQGFDEIDWAAIFEKAPKGQIIWNNVNDDGEIMGDDEIKEENKIKLPNDGIFIHAEESCGGGIIYLNNGKYEWIQQE
ncbi:hypothetical protein HNP37_004253 [Flavobacterium nitrogenifigens]|uniref:Uncharacterized protein n=2 Tax=Flavobacterium TaxID=237 RepID=A0A7W7NA65_9FLAO|nr:MULTISPECIES: hypothetical protein [Flavobacterium]MBB4804167.1 hypothetical protein [Flavobacterium nitrogenifigens]MBB6389126.1 hypothetical protein [Flavobacterium notoginsengisoli]